MNLLSHIKHTKNIQIPDSFIIMEVIGDRFGGQHGIFLVVPFLLEKDFFSGKGYFTDYTSAL
jgi:hypothetical protein